MQATKNNYLKFIDFRTLDKWYVSYYINPHILKSSFNFSKLKNLFKPIKDKIKLKDFKGDLRVVKKISFNDGKIHLREVNETKMDLYTMYPNDLLISKINFHQGALAINRFEKIVCTTHYQPYSVNRNLIYDEFLILVLRNKKFQNHLEFLRADGIKNEATYEFIGELEIPLPPLPEQEAIVANYYSKIREAEELERQAQDLEDEIERYLFDALDIKLNENYQKVNHLQFINFEDTSRWDSLFLLGKIQSLKSKYQFVYFSEVIKFFNKDSKYNTIRVDSSKFPNERFRYIGMEHIEKGTGMLLNLPIVRGKEIKSQTIKVPYGFILYGKLRPYLNKYWINMTEFDNIICSSEFFVFEIDESINKEFFKQILSSKIIQLQISDKTSGARMPRINEEIFFNLYFPLPPQSVQDEIANRIECIKEQIEKIKLKSFNLKEEAQLEFENAIFEL